MKIFLTLLLILNIGSIGSFDENDFLTDYELLVKESKIVYDFQVAIWNENLDCLSKVPSEFYKEYLSNTELFTREDDLFVIGYSQVKYSLVLLKQLVVDTEQLEVIYLKFNEKGQLIFSLTLAEEIEYPGGEVKTVSKITDNKLLLSKTRSFVGDFDKERNQYQEIVDSISTVYLINNYGSFIIQEKDSLRLIR